MVLSRFNGRADKKIGPRSQPRIDLAVRIEDAGYRWCQLKRGNQIAIPLEMGSDV